jgi:hypothetical protein
MPIPFSKLAGTDDYTKLRNAVTAIRNLGYKNPLLLDEPRLYDFTPGGLPTDLPHGFTLLGISTGTHNPEQGSKKALAQVVKLGPGPFIPAQAGELWNLNIRDIAFTGTTQSTFLAPSPRTLWRAGFHNLSFNVMYGIYGNETGKTLLTACRITGQQSIANCARTAIHIGGSDNKALFTEDTLIDSALDGENRYHVIADGLQKSRIGPIYVTCRNGWRGVLVRGGSEQLVFDNPTIEGRKPGELAAGPLFLVNGGSVTVRDGQFNHAWAGVHLESGRLVLANASFRVVNDHTQSADGTHIEWR